MTTTDTTADTLLTTDDLAFLRRPLLGFFTVAAGPVPPQPRPVWFEPADDGTIHLFTDAGARKVRQLRQDPRASLVVTTPVDERERWVSVSGTTTIDTGGSAETYDLARRLAAQYWDLGDAARTADLDGVLALDLARIVLRPNAVARYGF
ncbi:pyridoxamine 5'-phosphate oxidase [Saccharomonospora sp. CUA-673]|uniref:pyridoxamine 5'-phosphate oxidase family protein n=1 Tax=Saccharomonospora sp. CUA-673 TaxID=1904969 RepID=UPI000961F399|nr:pyridoxamine 5'-phosphate oxidase family protein [Saccharomonospora sp. CUA-673]OLT46916.1 pyridoxamine 5'-phosphate oxidase [Saccharomonospora sp. CUA-673]